MLYKFKSEAGGDVIMLEATGKQVLQVMGKSTDGKGILLPEQMACAHAALEAAIAEEEATAREARAQAKSEDPSSVPKTPPITLRTRAWPLVTLIERSAKAQVPITWGV